MTTEFPRIQTGPRAACTAPQPGRAMVHACKTCHKRLVGQPAQDAPDYLAIEDDGELYLNMIDPPVPLFTLGLFTRFLDWATPRYFDGQTVLIHCDQGESRSRSLALLLAARVGLIKGALSFTTASIEFSRVTGKLYRPGAGIRTFLAQNWSALVPQEPVKLRAAPAAKPIPPELVAPVAKVAGWKMAHAAELIDQREANDGWSDAEIDEISDNPHLWALSCGKVEDRVLKEPIEFDPSPLQARMFSYYRYCQTRGLPCREVVPKIRRGGGSTGGCGVMHCHAHNYTARLGCIGTDDTVAQNMFKMMRFFNEHDEFPGWGRATKILETGDMKWSNGSTWETYTAVKPEAARSAGLQGYHASEVGRWPNGGAMDAAATLRSMLGAVPRRGFTVVIEESTARGAVGAFYDRFQSARWPTAEELGVPEGLEFWRKWEDETPQNIARAETERALQFVRIFASWFEDEENRPEHGVSADEATDILATLDKKEIDLLARYKNTGPQGDRLGTTVERATMIEQLAWRRSVIATEFEGDVEGFEQENPSSPREAFASSGRHTFSRAGCSWMSEVAKGRTPMVGVFDRQQDGGVIFRETNRVDAWAQVWETPKVGMRYCGSLDTMGGRSHTQNLKTADYNAGLFLRAAYVDQQDGQKKPHRLVAALMPGNQDDPDVLAMKMDLMADWFGGCLVVHEDNNTGAAFRQEAMRLNMNLYRRQETDKFSLEMTEYVGWVTTGETRPQLIATGKKHIRNNAQVATRPDGVEAWSTTTVQELTDCVRGDDGKDQAPGNKHDDHMMALLIGLHCIDGATYFAGKKRRRQGPADRGRDGWRSVGSG